MRDPIKHRTNPIMKTAMTGQRDRDEGGRKGTMKTDTEEAIHFSLLIENRREESIHTSVQDEEQGDRRVSHISAPWRENNPLDFDYIPCYE
jgi:hypothetical protein